MNIKVGSIVRHMNPKGLFCGSGIYPHAIVTSVDPLILVSEQTDMLWSCTIKQSDLVPIGTASEEILRACMERMERDQRNATPLEHTRSCASLIGGDCTCCLAERRELDAWKEMAKCIHRYCDEHNIPKPPGTEPGIAWRIFYLVEQRDQFLLDALAAMSGAISTPENGYLALADVLADIKTLKKQQDGAIKQIEFLRAIVSQKNKVIARFLPCPDCRDKVKAGECERCKRQAIESRLGNALRESIEVLERVPVDIRGSEDVRRQIRTNRAVLEAIP